MSVYAQSPDPWSGLIVATPQSADYNQNGTIDTGDYVAWRKSNINGQPGYDLWRANYGNVAGSGRSLNSANIPEPTTVVLIFLAVPAFALFKNPCCCN